MSDKLGEIAERLAEDIGWAQGPIFAALQQARDLGREEAQAEVERLKEIDRASFRAWEKSEAEVERLRALISAIREAALAVGVGIVYMGGVPIVSVNHEEMDA